jgi:hypothetical protein
LKTIFYTRENDVTVDFPIIYLYRSRKFRKKFMSIHMYSFFVFFQNYS